MRKVAALCGRPRRSWCTATLTLQMLVLTAPVTLALWPQLRGSQLACAQSATTGAIRGEVRNVKTGELLVGATVIVTSLALQGNQSAVTDDNGEYLLTALPPGTYTVWTYYADAQVEHAGVDVRANVVVTSHASIKPEEMGAEPIIVRPRATTFVDNCNRGIHLSKEVLANQEPPRTTPTQCSAAQVTSTPPLQVVYVTHSTRCWNPSREPPYTVDPFRTGVLSKTGPSGRLSVANLCFAGIGQCGR